MDSPAAPARFCAAPWLESVLYNDGSYRICCRNSRVFGDWKHAPLEQTWNGRELREFRAKVTRGEYPDSDCAACHRSGSAQSLERILGTPLVNALDALFRQGLLSDEEKVNLKRIAELFPIGAEGVAEAAQVYESVVADFRDRAPLSPEAAAEFNKVFNILAITRAFHAGDEAPRVVGPFRQVQLIAKCNARCVMCPGKFSGEIVNGDAIAESEVAAAMAAPSDIVDFFCNGSEFLLFKGWKQVAHALRAGGSANLRLSTNGMLLTKDTAEYLIQNQLIGHLNVSFNAGTRETLERVQGQVKWDRLIANVEHAIRYAEEKGNYFPLSFSFIVMRSNLADLLPFLERVATWKRQCRLLDPNVMLMGLENTGAKDYRSFLYAEHLSFAPSAEIQGAFRRADELTRAERISVQLYNFSSFRTLREYVAADAPVQGFVGQPAADREQIEIQVRAALNAAFEAALLAARAAMNAAFAAMPEHRFPAGDRLRLSWAGIADAVLGFLALAPVSPSAGLANLFSAVPQCRQIFEGYRAEWRAHLADRLRRDLEVVYWRLFAELFGRPREALADHRGEKYLALPGLVSLRELSPGARLLGEDMHFWELVYASDQSVYLHSHDTDEVRLASQEFIVGAFVLDEPLKLLPEKLRAMRERAFLQAEYHDKLNVHFETLLAAGREKVHALLVENETRGGVLPGSLARAFEGVREGQRRAFRAYLGELMAQKSEGQLRLDEETVKLYESWADQQLERFLARRVLLLLGVARSGLHDHYGMQYVTRLETLRLSEGALLLGKDHQVWTFLRRRGGVYYLASEDLARIQIAPAEFVLGAFPFEPGVDGPALRSLLRRADFHWRTHQLKQRLVGQRKSPLLWKLSQVYRSGLRKVGMETSSDLVIH